MFERGDMSSRTSVNAVPFTSMIVTCKGRLDHLRKTLPSMYAQVCDFPFEIIVVDYADPDRSFEWVSAQRLPILKALRVTDNAEWFNLSRARNCGAVRAAGKFLAFVDADVMLAPAWLAASLTRLREANAVLATSDTNKRAGAGICVVTADIFRQVRGFDERLEGWGYEDHDFCHRCRQQGRETFFDGALLSVLKHSDTQRVQFYRDKDRFRSNRRNKIASRTNRTEVNPTGFGICECQRSEGWGD